MPASRRLRVDEVGRKGRADTKDAANPDRQTADTLGTFQAQATKQFEQADFSTVAGGKKEGQSKHKGAPDGSGTGPSFAAQGTARGHKEINFASVKGHGVAKRSAGKTTGTDEKTARDLSTAGS
jgi:hypothetical protein